MGFRKLNNLSTQELAKEYYSFKRHTHAAKAWNVDTIKLSNYLENKGITKIERIICDTRVCKKCKIEKKIEQFEKCGSEFYRRYVCNHCRWQTKTKKAQKTRIKINKTLIVSKIKIDKKAENRQCIHCYKILLNNCFNKCVSVCDDCRRKQLRKSDNNRLHSSPIHKLRLYTSNAIKRGLKRQNGSKLGASIMKHLPYSIEEFKSHIENLWEPWMTWENYGTLKKGEKRWNIDHIIPQSKLPYDSMEHPNFQKCWALDNLRPLDALENTKKSDKL